MEALQVCTGNLKVSDPCIGIELLKKQARRILNKLDVGAIQLGKCLLVFALDHDLCLGLEGAEAVALDLFDT